MKYRRSGFLALVYLVLIGCGEPQEVLVAEVGPYQISAASLRAFVEKLLPGQRTQKTGEAGRRHYLQVLVDGRLLLLEARSRGLDTTRVVQKAVQKGVDEDVRALYRKQEIPSVAEISEAELRRYFEEEGFDRERLFCGILVETRAQIEEVVRELEAGRPFAELASAYSLDQRTAAQGGEMGFIGRNMLAQFYVPPDLFRSLPLGEVSIPLPAGRRAWHVFRFSEERPATFAKYRLFIRAQLRAERKFQAKREHLEMLRESFQVRLNPAGLQEVMQAYQQRDPAALKASPTALYKHDKGEISVAEAQEALQALTPGKVFGDSTEAVYVLDSGVLRPFLLQRAAREVGLYERPEIRQLQKRKQEDLLLEQLKEMAVTRHLDLSDEEIRHYYDSHPEYFRIDSSTQVEEILLATEAEARQVREQLIEGVPFAKFADRSLRESAQEDKGQFHYHLRDKVLHPKLVPAVVEAPVGEFVGPVEVEGGYSVFRVLGREPESREPYERAQQRARTLLRRERGAQELEKLVKDLREKYISQVKIYDAHLMRALPDSLVQG